MGNSIYGMVYEELGAKTKHLPKFNTKIAKSVFDMLDREDIADIILDGDVFWFESYIQGNRCGEKQRQWLIKYLTNKGYRYLYSIPCNH